MTELCIVHVTSHARLLAASYVLNVGRLFPARLICRNGARVASLQNEWDSSDYFETDECEFARWYHAPRCRHGEPPHVPTCRAPTADACAA